MQQFLNSYKNETAMQHTGMVLSSEFFGRQNQCFFSGSKWHWICSLMKLKLQISSKSSNLLTSTTTFSAKKETIVGDGYSE